ncbi:sensor histidine kinase [Propionicimonas sp.]|uniref:sensor histidine kinase n=1 Tax=Propionicimonas sp. TaxID=1955623 RepID=UPI0039E3F3CE
MRIRIDRRMPATERGEPASAAGRWSILAATVLIAPLAAVDLVGEWFAVAGVCVVPSCSPPELTVDAAADLIRQGVSLSVWATASVVVTAVTTLVPLLLALLVGWRGTRPATLTIPPILLLTALGPAAAFAPAPWLQAVLGVLPQLALFALLASYPGGRFRPWGSAVPVIFAAAWAAVTAVPPIPSAVAANEQPWASLYGVGFALALAGIVAGLVVRFVRGDAGIKRAILLLAVGLGLFVCYGAGFSVYQGIDAERAGIGTLLGSASNQVVDLMLALILGIIALAVVRDGAYGVRVTLNRVLLGAIGLGIVLAVDAAVVVLGSLALEGWLPQALGSAAAALALFLVFRPIIRGIDRLVYGDADDPGRLATRLSAALAAAPDSRSVVPELLEVLAERLRLPWVVLAAPGDPGTADASGIAIPLDPADPGAAVLTVGLRAGQRRLRRRDRAALRAAAPTLLSGLAAVRLTDELQASRRRVVSAAEEERRALRRELHDGLGPTLAAARHRIAAARADAGDTDPSSHLARAEQQLTESVETIRALARRLRPPALDEHGLARALENAADDLGLAATVSVPLDPLPDLLEVALYRITVEALANTARHAAATRATVRIGASGREIILDIADDGIGVGEQPIGVGIASMRERAAELGGRLTITQLPDGGTLVNARLPIPDGAVA